MHAGTAHGCPPELLRDTPLRYLNLAVYLTPRLPDLGRLSRLAEAAEAAHFWAAVLLTPTVGYAWAIGRRWEAALFLLIQLVANVYPILHLRLVRGRLERILQRRPRERESMLNEDAIDDCATS